MKQCAFASQPYLAHVQNPLSEKAPTMW